MISAILNWIKISANLSNSRRNVHRLRVIIINWWKLAVVTGTMQVLDTHKSTVPLDAQGI